MDDSFVKWLDNAVKLIQKSNITNSLLLAILIIVTSGGIAHLTVRNNYNADRMQRVEEGNKEIKEMLLNFVSHKFGREGSLDTHRATNGERILDTQIGVREIRTEIKQIAKKLDCSCKPAPTVINHQHGSATAQTNKAIEFNVNKVR